MAHEACALCAKQREVSPMGTELRRAQCAKQAKRKSNEGERGGAASGAHEGRAQCAKQAVVSPMSKGVLQAVGRSRTTIAN